MRTSLFATAILLLTLFAACSSVLACDCVSPEPLEGFRRSDVVFEGEVVYGFQRKDFSNAYLNSIGYVFRVSRTLKGKPVPEVKIFTGASDCGASFVFGGVYRVYAKQVKDELQSYACAGNEHLYQRTVLTSAAVSAPHANSTFASLWKIWYVKALFVSSYCVLMTLLLYYGRAFRRGLA